MLEEKLAHWFAEMPWPFLMAVIAISMAALGKGADLLVEAAVVLSQRSGVPKVVIGATVVSLGTTTPEAFVSVLAALQGKPDLALGNAVGSIICDTGLILGLACLISPPRLDRRIVNRQGWVQFGAGWMLVLCCLPWARPFAAFTEGGNLNQRFGLLFLVLLVLYMVFSVRWARVNGSQTEAEAVPVHLQLPPRLWGHLARLLLAISVVVTASWLLIPAVSEAALRLRVPDSVIAATLVAFGTSLPELVTAVTAARRGHGELAVGNVIGADILNVLFVSGAAAAVTRGGLDAPAPFFTLYFPSMLFILLTFRAGVYLSGERLQRPFGIVLLGVYLLVTVVSYTVR